jgi:hypothetical protein
MENIFSTINETFDQYRTLILIVSGSGKFD